MLSVQPRCCALDVCTPDVVLVLQITSLCDGRVALTGHEQTVIYFVTELDRKYQLDGGELSIPRKVLYGYIVARNIHGKQASGGREICLQLFVSRRDPGSKLGKACSRKLFMLNLEQLQISTGNNYIKWIWYRLVSRQDITPWFLRVVTHKIF